MSQICYKVFHSDIITTHKTDITTHQTDITTDQIDNGW